MSNELGKPELQALLEKNNVEGWNSRTSIVDLTQLALDNDLVEEGGDEDENEKVKPAPKGKFYLWVKKKVYINDEQRVDKGVYAVDEVPERFENSRAVVVYKKEIPAGSLAVIARWCGINPDGRDEEELLALVVNKDGVQPY